MEESTKTIPRLSLEKDTCFEQWSQSLQSQDTTSRTRTEDALVVLSVKIARRNLPKRRARTILTVTAVFLGVALLVGINMATTSALGEFNGYINKFWGATDIVVSSGNGLPFSNQTVTTIRSNPLVAQTAERLDSIGWIGTSTTSPFIISGLEPKNDFDYAGFNVTGSRQILQGQAVVDNAIAQRRGLVIGSGFTITTPTSQLTNTTISLTVVGINYPLRNLGSTVYMLLPELQSDARLQGLITQIYATLADPSQAVSVELQLQRVLPSFTVSAPKAEAVQRIDAQTAGFEIGLNVMIGVSLVVCSFIVFNTLFMTVSERTYEIGILRAVGSSRGQIFRIFLVEGLLLGGFGTITGIFGGLGLARLFTFIFQSLFDIPNLPVAQLTLTIGLTGMGAGLGAVLMGAIYPSFAASRINVIQAIRPSARNSSRAVPLPVVGTIGAALLILGAGESLRLTPFHVNYLDVVLVPLGLVFLGAAVFGKASRSLTVPVFPFSNALRYIASRSGRRRLLRSSICFGMIVLTLSFAIMIGGIQRGVQGALVQGIQEALGADIILVANQSIPVSFTQNLTSLSTIADATPMSPSDVPSRAYGQTAASSIGVIAIDPSVFPRIISYTFVGSSDSAQAYSQLENDNRSLILPDSLASKLGVQVGDTLPVLTRISNNTIPFKVVGIFTGAVLQYIRLGANFASDSIVVSLASQHEYFAGRNSSPLFLVDLKNAYKSEATTVADQLSIRYPQYNFSEGTITFGELLALVNDTINRIFALILLILYFALLIASLGIGATMIMNVSDRRREIGLLRSQGMSRGQIMRLFTGEGVLLGVFGFLLAVPGGLLLLKGATNSTTLAGFFIPYVVPYSAILQALALAIAAVLAGSIYPALRAARMEITEALERV